ncbi:rho-related GTP-binding protein RhoC-like [Littorina saxatilis]|uniref:Uncharacterized protein n=1 Tax=Littorina saxatilis TaxID=31220 RepID=A0AAN9AKA1_9CAEN
MDFLCWCCLSPAWDDADDDTSLSRKLTVVGDGACGKTSLLLRISRDVFDDDSYDPTAYEKDVVDVFAGNRKIEMVLQDCAGQETFDRLRPVVYAETDVILICFSLDNPDSLFNVENSWIQEVQFYCPDVPIILVGNKKDLRDSGPNGLTSTGQKFVTSQEGKDVAKRIQAKGYFECSAKDGENCKKLLGASVRYSTMHRPFNSESAR